MILEQFLINKTKEIDNPISNWGIGFTAEVIKEWIDLQVKVKKLTIPVVSKSFTLEDVKRAVDHWGMTDVPKEEIAKLLNVC